jgi:hypothetical protein
MTETTATAAGPSDVADVVFPPGRYGRRREPRRHRRWVPATLTALVVVAGVAAAVRMGDTLGVEYDSRVQSFELGDDAVTITFEVYRPAGEDVVCRLRSRDFAGAEVGVAEVHLPASSETRTVTTYTLPVAGVPNTAEVQRCWRAD